MSIDYAEVETLIRTHKTFLLSLHSSVDDVAFQINKIDQLEMTLMTLDTRQQVASTQQNLLREKTGLLLSLLHQQREELRQHAAKLEEQIIKMKQQHIALSQQAERLQRIQAKLQLHSSSQQALGERS